MKKLLFIMNPNAGTRRANPMLTQIIETFNRGGWEVTIYMTGKTGDAEKFVRQKGADVDMVVCCGGDGTFNQTLTGILDSKLSVPLGYIPAGSTNDFAASLKLSSDPLVAAQEIVDGKAQIFDAGRFAQRYFSYTASFGVFTKTSYTTPQNLKNALGHMAYILEGIQELGQLRTHYVRMETENRVEEGQYLFGAICNSTSLGGILKLDPSQVDMCDGLFEVMLIRKPKNIAEVTECIQALRRQQYNCKMMTFFSASKLKITAEPDMCWTLDGERESGHKEILVENIHKGYRLVKKHD